MIAGLGTDIVEIGRIVRMLDKFGDAFRERICTPAELAEGSRRRHASTYYAGRWAVKEAAAKALGCGIGEHCSFTDVELGNGPAGAPFLKLSGKAVIGTVGASRRSKRVKASRNASTMVPRRFCAFL